MISSSTDAKEVRKFGIIAFPFFGFICSIAIWRQKVPLIFFFGTLSLLGLGFLLFPSPLKRVYEIWLNIAHFIGRTITIIMLTLAYYLVITPSAFLKRLFGGPPISSKPDKNASSYWVSRSEMAQPKERFIKRF